MSFNLFTLFENKELRNEIFNRLSFRERIQVQMELRSTNTLAKDVAEDTGLWTKLVVKDYKEFAARMSCLAPRWQELILDEKLTIQSAEFLQLDTDERVRQLFTEEQQGEINREIDVHFVMKNNGYAVALYEGLITLEQFLNDEKYWQFRLALHADEKDFNLIAAMREKLLSLDQLVVIEMDTLILITMEKKILTMLRGKEITPEQLAAISTDYLLLVVDKNLLVNTAEMLSLSPEGRISKIFNAEELREVEALVENLFSEDEEPVYPQEFILDLIKDDRIAAALFEKLLTVEQLIKSGILIRFLQDDTRWNLFSLLRDNFFKQVNSLGTDALYLITQDSSIAEVFIAEALREEALTFEQVNSDSIEAEYKCLIAGKIISNETARLMMVKNKEEVFNTLITQEEQKMLASKCDLENLKERVCNKDDMRLRVLLSEKILVTEDLLHPDFDRFYASLNARKKYSFLLPKLKEHLVSPWQLSRMDKAVIEEFDNKNSCFLSALREPLFSPEQLIYLGEHARLFLLSILSIFKKGSHNSANKKYMSLIAILRNKLMTLEQLAENPSALATICCDAGVVALKNGLITPEEVIETPKEKLEQELKERVLVYKEKRLSELSATPALQQKNFNDNPDLQEKFRASAII
jgi:hypothetical protein